MSILANTVKKNSLTGFTLIELIMVIAIIGILSVSGAYLMINLVRNAIFIPNQLNMDMLASHSLEIMIEGDSLAKGLRYSKYISAIADNELTFVDQSGQNISYKIDTGTSKLYRSIAGGAWAFIPYYLQSGINVTGKSNKLFTYYDSSNGTTSTPSSVRRIKITLIAKTGTGSYSDWEGSSEQSSSIAVKRFQ